MTTTSLEPSFENALAALYSPLHNQVTTIAAMEAAQDRRHLAIVEMRTYIQRLESSNLVVVPTSGGSDSSSSSRRRPKIIHITGTKGKGSTAAMCESICRRVYRQNTGLFTSPHLCDIRERIRINGLPVSKQVFATAYWTIRISLERFSEEETDNDPNVRGLPVLPGYFRMLTLMALYVFSNYDSPVVDVIILEVGMGGRYDATNLIDLDDGGDDDGERRFVCGVTLIDYDHVRVLGNTLEEIAWEKGGIFQVNKEHCACITPKPHSKDLNLFDGVSATEKPPDKPRTFYTLESNTPKVLDVLRLCAKNEGMGGMLQLVGPESSQNLLRFLPTSEKMGLTGLHQRQNALLAVALVQHLLDSSKSDTDTVTTDANISSWHGALSSVSWPGRCQSIKYFNNLTLRIDGAHTEQSIQVGLEWFQTADAAAKSLSLSSAATRLKRVLIFYCSHEKNPVELLEILKSRGCFDMVCFCQPNSQRPSAVPPKSGKELLEERGRSVAYSTVTSGSDWKDALMFVWQHLDAQEVSESSTPQTPVVLRTFSNVLEALQYLQDQTKGASDPDTVEMEVFATGSLYLAGSVLEAVRWNEPDAPGRLLVASGTFSS